MEKSEANLSYRSYLIKSKKHNHFPESQPEWDEVVNSEIFTLRVKNRGCEVAETTNVYLSDLVRKYFGIDTVPVRIKCRDGAILIERVK
jgi:hypothetical protein